MRAMIALLVFAMLSTCALAQPDVPDGFTARRIAPLLDGRIPKLAAINDPSGFGVGAVAGTARDGVVSFRLVRADGSLTTLGTWVGPVTVNNFIRARVDHSGLVFEGLHATVRENAAADSHYITVDSSGETIRRWERTNEVNFDFDISAPQAGNPAGSILYDLDASTGSGQQLGFMDDTFGVTITRSNFIPPGRVDVDGGGFRTDSTGIYGGGVLFADTDLNSDQKSAIYEIRDVSSGGTWRVIASPVSTSVRRYGDLDIAAAGDFGGVIYVTETLSNEIQQVAPDGTHSTWATGFTGIESLSISPDGNSMYVADLNGVWLIRAAGNEPGPVVLTHEPNDAGGSHLTGDPTNFFRIIFNEPVTFTDADVTITDRLGQAVAFDASGSSSQFMLIGLATPLFSDTYTITLSDSITGVATGQPLDGDGDGFAGGDAIIAITHQCPADIDGDGDADADDFFLYLDFFAQGC